MNGITSLPVFSFLIWHISESLLTFFFFHLQLLQEMLDILL